MIRGTTPELDYEQQSSAPPPAPTSNKKKQSSEALRALQEFGMKEAERVKAEQRKPKPQQQPTSKGVLRRAFDYFMGTDEPAPKPKDKK